MSGRPWPLDVDLLLQRGTLEGPFRRLGPMTAGRRAARMVRALCRDTGRILNSAWQWLRNLRSTK